MSAMSSDQEDDLHGELHRVMDVQDGIQVAIGVVMRLAQVEFARREDEKASGLRALCDDIGKELIPLKKREIELRKELGLPLS